MKNGKFQKDLVIINNKKKVNMEDFLKNLSREQMIEIIFNFLNCFQDIREIDIVKEKIERDYWLPTCRETIRDIYDEAKKMVLEIENNKLLS